MNNLDSLETDQATEINPILLRPTAVADIPDDRAKALADLDGTLTKPGSELLIQRFLQDVQVGSGHMRDKLDARFEEWADARRRGQNPEYETYLTDVGDLWAKTLARGDHKKTRSELMEITGNWFRQKGVKEVMDYSPGVIQLMKDREFAPIMVTGAPYEIAAHFADHLGIEHMFAMEAEVDERENYTGVMEHNTGLGRTKGKICEYLQEARHKILYAMGDTHSDMVLMRAAIEFNGRHDGRGRSVLINPRLETKSGLKKWAPDYVSNGKIISIEQHTARSEVLRVIGHLLDDILKENKMKNGLIEKVA